MIELGRRVLGVRQLNHLVRFQPIIDLVGAKDSLPGTLLDVGSGSRGVASLLPAGWNAISLDANFEDYAGPGGVSTRGPEQVIGDVRALPFEDNAFDVVVAVDLLEHVPVADRAQAIREICRVARKRAVLACPAGADALAADRRLAASLRGRGHAVPPWLEEHLENGFPDVAELIEAARQFGSVQALSNENLAAHERLIAAEHTLVPAAALRLICRPLEKLMASRRPRARRLASEFLLRVRGGDDPPTYRVIVNVDSPVVGFGQRRRQYSE